MRRTVRVRVECGVRAGLRADTVKSKLSLNSHGQVSHDDSHGSRWSIGNEHQWLKLASHCAFIQELHCFWVVPNSGDPQCPSSAPRTGSHNPPVVEAKLVKSPRA